MAKAYPRYYRKPSALKSMPSMLKGLCQGCGTRQVKQGIKVGFGPREKVKRFCAVSIFFSPLKHLSCPFILFFKFIFNWRIIVLQYCVGFCHTSVWISHRYTHVPFLLNLPPTFHPISPPRLSQSTWFELPTSYSKFPLAIYFTYGNLCCHPTVDLSSFPHSVHRSVFYVCISVVALQMDSSIPSFQVPYICINIKHLFFSFWLHSV